MKVKGVVPYNALMKSSIASAAVSALVVTPIDFLFTNYYVRNFL
jgi:hypothetical protein